MSNQFTRILNSCLHFMQKLPAQASQPCLLCDAGVRGKPLCPGCLADLPWLPADRCPQCALPSHQGMLCGQCLRTPRAFDSTEAVLAYEFPLNVLVRQCKYQGALEITRLFADLLAQRLAHRAQADLILPMPLYPARLAERGFNQAGEIARRLSRQLAIPWLAEGCQRIRDTPSQAGLDLKARRRNLRGAFRCDLDLTGRRVALVDDVMTSGTSLDELARTVKQAGALEVHAWVVARTL